MQLFARAPGAPAVGVPNDAAGGTAYAVGGQNGNRPRVWTPTRHWPDLMWSVASARVRREPADVEGSADVGAVSFSVILEGPQHLKLMATNP